MPRVRKRFIASFLALAFLGVALRVVRASTPLTTSNTGSAGTGYIQFMSPNLRTMGKYSVLFWYYSITQFANLQLLNGGPSQTPFSRWSGPGNLDVITGRAINGTYRGTGIMPAVNKWYCIGYTMDIGANPEVVMYIGDATTPMAAFSTTQVGLGSGAINDNSGIFQLGTTGGGSSAPGSYGFVAVATGIWTAQTFENNRLTPRPQSDTLLMAWITTESTPTITSLVNGTTGQMNGMASQAGGPPILSPFWWNKKSSYVFMRKRP